jgi:acyl dehydratase
MRRAFTDVEEGDELPACEIELSADRIREYARAAGMWAPRFTDDEAARREGLPGMIAPGNLSMGLLGEHVERWAGVGGLRRLGTTFRGIVRPGRLRLCGAVTQCDEATRTVELDLWLENEDGERSVIGTATVALT